MSAELDAHMRERFDAVVMLTASNWHAEPRSNRYHYATRFARILPVIFVQADRPGPGSQYEESGYEGITLLHVCNRFTMEQAQAIAAALAQRGIKRPLLWSYRGGYHMVLRCVHSAFCVYHATEDYYADEYRAQLPQDFYSDLEYFVAQTDLIVAVSNGVRDSYTQHCKGVTRCIVLENGCDDAFWKKFSRVPVDAATVRQTRVAFYQGGINFRLDYALIRDMTAAMPDWQFWFCGTRDPEDENWKSIAKLANVRDLGVLAPEQVAVIAGQADVGVIPFIQTPFITEVSLPLKAFEYVACDLPVVSVPIRALEPWSELFAFAANAPEFTAAIRRVAPMRGDPAAQTRRAVASAQQDYGRRFEELLNAIHATPRAVGRYKVLVMYDAESDGDTVLCNMLAEVGRFSRHEICFLMAATDQPLHCDLSMFDVVCVHDDPHVPALPDVTARTVVASGTYRVLFFNAVHGDSSRAARKLAQIAGHAVMTQAALAGRVENGAFPGARILDLNTDQPQAMAALLDDFLETGVGRAKPYIFVQELRAVMQSGRGDAAAEVVRALPGVPHLLSRMLSDRPVMLRAAAEQLTAPLVLDPMEVDRFLAGLKSQVLLRTLIVRWIKAFVRLLPPGAQIRLLRVLRLLAGWLKLL